MATDQIAPVHPGDIIQDSDGFLHLVTSVQRWGVGAVHRWRDARRVEGETYARFKRDQFVVVGAAHMLPEDIARARRASLATAAAVAAEGAGGGQ